MEVPQGVRVTVRLDEKEKEKFDAIQQTPVKYFSGAVVALSEPSQKLGVYWGYQVRIVQSFKELLEFPDRSKRYDLTLGTSDKGQILNNLVKSNQEFKRKMKESESILICFGGLDGIEGMLQNLETLEEKTALQLFEYYINTCPQQGSRTIRTEEALLISLAAFQTAIQ